MGINPDNLQRRNCDQLCASVRVEQRPDPWYGCGAVSCLLYTRLWRPDLNLERSSPAPDWATDQLAEEHSSRPHNPRVAHRAP